LKIVKDNCLSLKEYKVLYDTYYTSLCLFANRYLRDLDLSKDVVQEVFVKIWCQQIILENENSFRSYLYTAVQNKSLDYLKSKEYKGGQKLTDCELEIVESDNYFEKELLLVEVERMVNQAVNTLPYKCKSIIQLSLKGLKNSQISEELQISINTVKTQKKIAYQKLRPVLKLISCYLLVTFHFLNNL
jgi:RNA polymerase sigma-70 factor (ECF subfamily)